MVGEVVEAHLVEAQPMYIRRQRLIRELALANPEEEEAIQDPGKGRRQALCGTGWHRNHSTHPAAAGHPTVRSANYDIMAPYGEVG